MKKFKAIYSINFDKIPRSPKRIIYLIFHYTGMASEKKGDTETYQQKFKSKLSLLYKKKW